MKFQDMRTWLPEGTVLPFPELSCTVEGRCGKGSNSLVYTGSYPDAQLPDLRHRVLIKELFPYDPRGGITRRENGDGAEVGEIVYEGPAAELFELHRYSFLRSNEVHLKLLDAYPDALGGNINTYGLGNTLYSVLPYNAGQTLAQACPGAESSLRQLISRIQGLLRALSTFHRAGYLHLDISPDNILLIGQGEPGSMAAFELVSLIDFNSVHTLAEIRSGNALYYSGKEGYTAPEVRRGKLHSIGPETDLYSVCAVLYRCLMGHPLSGMQALRAAAPNLDGAICLQGIPETALALARHIVHRGLSALPSRRYHSTDEIYADLAELQDRLEGRGITHAALWEIGRAGVMRQIRNNPAIDLAGTYPVQVRLAPGAESSGNPEDIEDTAVADLMAAMLAGERPGGRSLVLLGAGGMGKTTALMQAAHTAAQRYVASQPATLYLPLYGYVSPLETYITDRILEQMRFRGEDVESARQALRQFLQTPLPDGRGGEKPRLLLLLDGLNEAQGDLAPLLREIQALAAMPGVSLCVSSRSEVSGLSLSRATLTGLTEPEVARQLQACGVLPPERDSMRELLHTPMLLHLYIRASLDGKQEFALESESQLIHTYLRSLQGRESQPDEALVWQMEAAVYYVLPQLAKQLQARGGALSDSDLLPIVRTCYERLSSRLLLRHFPTWTGHLTDIRGGAESAEAWYGLIVHRLLWRRLGLLVRDAEQNIRVSHQIFEAYVSGMGTDLRRQFLYIRVLRIGMLCCLAAISLLAGICYLPRVLPAQAPEPVYYSEKLTDRVLDTAILAYADFATMYQDMQNALSAAQDGDDQKFVRAVQVCEQTLNQDLSERLDTAQKLTETLSATEGVMPGTKQPLDMASYRALTELPTALAEKYRAYLDGLVRRYTHRQLWADYGEAYSGLLQDALESDAYVAGKLYRVLIGPELEVLDEQTRQRYASTLVAYESVERIMENAENLYEVYLEMQQNAQTRLETQDVSARVLERLESQENQANPEGQDVQNAEKGEDEG